MLQILLPMLNKVSPLPSAQDPKDRTWVRFPSPAPDFPKIHVDSAALTHQPSLDLCAIDRGFAPILRPNQRCGGAV